MTIAGTERTTTTAMHELRNVDGFAAHQDDQNAREPGPRIALLTPYSGDNLGDAAIQDAMIANIRVRLTGAEFSGITLNGNKFVERHGVSAFPLLSPDLPQFESSSGKLAEQPRQTKGRAGESRPKSSERWTQPIRSSLRSVPGLGQFLKKTQARLAAIQREIHHCVEGYRFLRTHDLLVVSGGGQLDEGWGGSWRYPFALFKWAVLARIAHVPFAIASVGAGEVSTGTSRMFLSIALRLACYRSYRDANTRKIAAGLLSGASKDPVVPDLAFSLPSVELPPPADIRSIGQGRPVIAISPISYAKLGCWYYENQALHDRYLQQMALVVSELLGRGYFLVMVWSCLGDDEGVVTELLGRLDDEPNKRLAAQIHIPTIATWKDLVALLGDVDFLVASRLHSAILAFVTQTPTVAISFDPKVDWVMEDLGQTDSLLQIRDFRAEDVIKALDGLELRRDAVVKQIASYQHRISPDSAVQYDTLAGLALTRRRN